jgi:alpha-beta hydrolase superfamily lysophospholipase
MFFSTNPKLALSSIAATASALGLADSASTEQPVQVLHRTAKVGDLEIFYREAGPNDAPTVLLPHGFPTSSQMFRKFIPALADQYHLIAPDYPGYGHSSMPPRDQFSCTFDNLAKVIDEFTAKLGPTKYEVTEFASSRRKRRWAPGRRAKQELRPWRTIFVHLRRGDW